MKAFIEDILMGMMFIITVVMTVCALLIGALSVAATIAGEMHLTDAVGWVLLCAILGGCAMAIGRRIDLL